MRFGSSGSLLVKPVTQGEENSQFSVVPCEMNHWVLSHLEEGPSRCYDKLSIAVFALKTTSQCQVETNQDTPGGEGRLKEALLPYFASVI